MTDINRERQLRDYGHKRADLRHGASIERREQLTDEQRRVAAIQLDTARSAANAAEDVVRSADHLVSMLRRHESVIHTARQRLALDPSLTLADLVTLSHELRESTARLAHAQTDLGHAIARSQPPTAREERRR